MKKNRKLYEFGDLNVFVDTGYLYYYVIYGAFNMWSKMYPDRYKQRCPTEPSIDDLPDLTTDDRYIMCLEKKFQHNLDKIFYIIKNKVFEGYTPPGIKTRIYFCNDSKPYWRTEILYPEYKMQRKLSRKYFNTGKAFNYLSNVIVPKLDIENFFGIKTLNVNGAEADDLIMVLCRNIKHNNNIIIGTDHDLIQVLDKARMFDLIGREITTSKIAYKLVKENIEITPKEYLLTKFIMGDKSDNIQSVFNRCGPKTAFKLVKNTDKLRKKLISGGKSAYDRLELNRNLIDAKRIPRNIQKQIIMEYSRIR